jgi:hypothetical protein
MTRFFRVYSVFGRRIVKLFMKEESAEPVIDGLGPAPTREPDVFLLSEME